MKRMLIALVALSAIASSADAETDTFRYKAHGADAAFWTQGLCSFTSVYVGASESASKDGPGKATESAQVWVYLSSFDWCAGTDVEAAGNAVLPTGAFSYSKLDTAALAATVTMTDMATGSTFDLAVNLSWAASGETFRGLDRSHFWGQGFSVNSRWSGSSRDAAMTGSITSGPTDYAAGTESYGTLSDVSSGSTAVIH